MKHTSRKHVGRRRILLLAVLVLATYILLPQLGQFHTSFSAIQNANLALLAGAFLCILGAALTAALAYGQLSFKRIPFYRFALIQYAGMFINRLLPAGMGGISLFIDFLYRQGHSFARASTIAAINNILGFAAHLTLLLATAFATGFTAVPTLKINNILWYGVAVFVLAMVVWLAFYYVRRFPSIAKLGKSILRTLQQFRKRKLALLRAYICCLGTTSLHVVALSLVIRAFGVELPLAASLVILTGGVAAATITPTPGGVIGAEAALTAVLITYNVDSSTALAIALSYRFVSYWLPILPGVGAFLFVQNRKYI